MGRPPLLLIRCVWGGGYGPAPTAAHQVLEGEAVMAEEGCVVVRQSVPADPAAKGVVRAHELRVGWLVG